MPLQFKVPGYIGNGLLLLLSIVVLVTGSAVIGLLLAALAATALLFCVALGSGWRPSFLRERRSAPHWAGDNQGLDYPRNGGYAVFGKVIDGMDAVDKIAKAMKRTVGSLRQQALKLGIGLVHRR